ncbi:Gfo/Idh/MocA family protein [Paenibacillus mucilaginosus]|uniref:Oxidoreductase domain-containing protein n=2 Tax=Paenibacillus mucilaginosus TaxID=61624 RepID=H6NLI8_9BACL|nr:Gfo/Idh/MocA family oxidoreductase [Paenibacillus mucilaginosus]AEI43266.1 oxidoreductase domain protein [Paenibacillus mucilaginosus KNP414]AFC30922.1 oxidoreductase domain-containing protein [Paenibacillus mucilaginosus 3016]MCG7212179.1 Gfo/Idh/MocA family oxidoreductase [Paenibacillus mucilaginosus]WDM24851.1 Gfo/Idh/MocA family oxidoreductase [Paenibacillus mucilaginosus]WFA19522.1 Gfo/Idh/MocA family oxidoreductase [Paenibacillus mucilaginosus]
MEFIRPEHYAPGKLKTADGKPYGIGIIGCGSIANTAHLPAYRKYGLQVVACCDVNEEAARATAEAFGIPFWTTDVRKLLEREDVGIIDLAIHPEPRLQVLRLIAEAPRPVLCQKPLALEPKHALLLAEEAERLGIVLGVNQQARWAPAHKAMKAVLEQDLIGEVYSLQHVLRSFQDQAGRWWTTMKDFNIVDHGVHYIDLCRHFNPSSEEWSRVHCTTAMLPGQNAVDPLIYSANVEFGAAGGRSPLMASLQFNNIVKASRSHSHTWWIDGTEGSLWCTQDTLYMALNKHKNVIHEIKLKGSWFPDAFAGSMIAFINAVSEGQAPPVTARDNLQTVALTAAMVVSSKEGRVVERSEILGRTVTA